MWRILAFATCFQASRLLDDSSLTKPNLFTDERTQIFRFIKIVSSNRMIKSERSRVDRSSTQDTYSTFSWVVNRVDETLGWEGESNVRTTKVARERRGGVAAWSRWLGRYHWTVSAESQQQCSSGEASNAASQNWGLNSKRPQSSNSKHYSCLLRITIISNEALRGSQQRRRGGKSTTGTVLVQLSIFFSAGGTPATNLDTCALSTSLVWLLTQSRGDDENKRHECKEKGQTGDFERLRIWNTIYAAVTWYQGNIPPIRCPCWD